MRFVSLFLQNRKWIRLLFVAITLILLLALNFVVFNATESPGSLMAAIASSAMIVVTEFSPEIVSYISYRFGPSKYEIFVEKCAKSYSEYTEEYFSCQIPVDDEIAKQEDLFVYLDLVTSGVDGTPFGRTPQPDKRRRPVVPLLFVIKRGELLSVSDHENISAYIKMTYRSLTKKAKEEFVCAYDHLVLHDHKFAEVENYFDEPHSADIESLRLQFFDRYMKDDFIKEITDLLELQESQVRSFKQSVRAIAESEHFNLDYLRQFVRKRGEYRKLFIVTSDKRLPKRIQLWIRQQPHFILNYSSIANLPTIGTSSRFDIFFFSPRSLIATANDLLDQFETLDNTVQSHPLKIYEVDPANSISVLRDKPSVFTEAMTYFETGAFHPDSIQDLSYEQLLSVLEHRNISLKRVLVDLPPSEFSTIITSSEKQYINGVLDRYIPEDDHRGVFALADVGLGDVRDLINKESDVTIDYSQVEIDEIFNGNETFAKSRERIVDVFRDIKGRLDIIDEFVI